MESIGANRRADIMKEMEKLESKETHHGALVGEMGFWGS